jgi:hypothetical protein
MIIARRVLILRRRKGDVRIPVSMHAPEKAKVDWVCRYEIGWPEGKAKRWSGGVDAVQALQLAMSMIGVEVNVSRHAKSGRLQWLEQGRGYGFPVPSGIRDLLVGDDKRYF